MKFITLNLKKAGELIFQTTQIQEKDVRLKERAERTLKKKSFDFIKEQNRPDITLEQLYKEWLIYRRDYTSVKPKTIQEDISEWNRFFKDTELIHTKVKDVKPITLIRFFREVTRNREYTHKRISNARSVLNGIMSYAIEEEIIDHNPVSDVNFKQFTYKPVENQSDNVFSYEETQKLLSYVISARNLQALLLSHTIIFLSVYPCRRNKSDTVARY